LRVRAHRDRPPCPGDGALLPRLRRRLLDLLHVRRHGPRYANRRADLRRGLARRARGHDASRRNDQPSPRGRTAQGAVHGWCAPGGDGDLRGRQGELRSGWNLQPRQDGLGPAEDRAMTLGTELAQVVGPDNVEALGTSVWRTTPGTATEVAEVI